METNLITLTGFLGSDREIRFTQGRTRTATRYNEIAEMEEEYEVTTSGREYAVLSLATQQLVAGQWKTVWLRLIVWNLGQGMQWWNVRLARKGDRVRVTGRLETSRFTGDDGAERELTQVVVETYQCLRPKVRSEAAS